MPARRSSHIEQILPHGDVATVRLSLTPSATEEASIGSGGTEYLKFTPLAIEVLFADAGTEDFKLKASGTDIQDIHDANTENFKFTVSGVEAPQYPLVEAAVEYIKLVPSGVDLLAKQYTDAATEYLAFTITGHDCFAHVTPEYEIDLFKRWNMGSPNARWNVDSLDQRWNCFIVGTAFEIPC
jgi:hypothetical protein